MKLNINKTKFEKVSDVKVPDIFYHRLKTGIDVIDSAFGQGFLPSSTVVLSGEPGTGKTTFLLQILESLSIRKYNVGYVSGEECMELLKVNCDRIGVKNIMACNETNIDTILKQIPEFDAIVIDSFQSLNSNRDKSTSHEKYCVEQICAAAKVHQTTIFIITHITKSGKMKGSTLLPHSVDVVCNLKRHEDFDELEDKTVTLNITKNRFGPTLIKELNFTARGYDWTTVKNIPAESTVPPKSQRIKQETSTIKQLAEKLRDGKFSIDEVSKKISNKPRAYYVLSKLTKDGILEKVAKRGTSKMHYQFKSKK
jgi:predicted ATP-dependent serine protease